LEMERFDPKKMYKELYLPSTEEVAIVDVPEMGFLMVDGKGDPNTSKDFMDAVDALYSIAYTMKFMLKKEKVPYDFVVSPLEGLWWTRDEGGGFDYGSKDEWKWTVMIMQPDHVTGGHLERAKSEIRAKRLKKKEPVPAALDKVRLERFHEGPCVTIMHIGPFAAERPKIERMHAFAKGKGRSITGKHHEIYMSDPRRTPEAKWRTVLRQPIK
jgi:hypothetical protein